MTDLTIIGGQAATMTSLEIAELVASRHDKVKQSIERLVGRGTISLPPMGEVKVQRERREEVVSVYRFEGEKGKRDSYVVVAQLSPEFTGRLVDRWQELESRAGSFQVPRTRAEALRLAADLEEQNAVLQLENQHQAETIASLESLFMAGETPTQFCKRLNGVNCSKVNSTLCQLGWLFNEQREEEGAPRYRVASRVRDKYLTERPRKIAPEGGDSFIKYDLQLLLAGAQRLHQLYMQQKLAMKATWDGRFTQAKYTGEAV